MTMGYGGVFGKPKFLDTFGAPGGLMSPQMSPLPDVLSQQLPEMAAEKPKLFGKGGKGWQVLGIIGDALQTAGGGRGTYMPAMLDMQAKVDEERKWQAQLQQQRELGYAKLSKGPNPTQLQLNYEYAKQQVPGLTFQQFMQMYKPPMFNGADGQYIMDTPSGAPEGMTPMTPEEIKALGLNPGGPTATPSGSFR